MPSSEWPIYLGTSAGTPMAKLITQAGAQSIFDVADTTERAAVITALAAAGVDTTIVYVHRRDAAAGAELERTTDSGSTWRAIASAETAFTTLTLASGWAVDTGFDALAIRHLGNGQAALRGTRIARTGSSLAVSAGVGYTIATLTGTYVPATRHIGGCSYGVAGNLGAGPLLIGTTGDIQPVHWSANGTIATGGGISNSVWIPSQIINL